MQGKFSGFSGTLGGMGSRELHAREGENGKRENEKGSHFEDIVYNGLWQKR